MLDTIVRRLYMAVQHGAVTWNAELVRRAMYRQPLLARQLALGDRRAHRGAEDLRPASRQARKARLFQRQQDLARRGFLDAGKMRDLNGRQRLDVDLRMPLLEPTDHVGVITQSQLRM